jgi:hypothetical protein
MTQQLTTDILNAALENLTSKRQQIDEQITEVRRMLDNSTNGASVPAEAPTRKHRISAAGRQAIAAAQKRRWSEKKAASGETPAAGAKKPKRKLSPEGRKAIVAALKKRWAAKRAAATTSPKKSSKKVQARTATAKAATATASGE